MAESGESEPTPPFPDVPAPTSTDMGGCDAFISYATPDLAVALSACDALERAGISCWMAPRDVIPGEFYGDAIVNAIDGSKTTVLVLSQGAAASPHVLIELERTTAKRHPIISLRIDQSPLPAALQYFLNTSQWLDASGGDVVHALPKLVEAARRAIAGRQHAVAGSVPPAAAAPPNFESPWRSNNSRLVVIAAVILVLLAAFAAGRVWLARPHAQVPVAVAFEPPAHSIAVLPFVNMSGDASQEYFSDGISEELLDALSRVSELQVVAGTSSFSFKGQNLDIPTIARKLNVGVILEGSVRRAGNTVRITVQLINAVSGYHLWSQTYDRNLDDILQVQTDVARSVAQQLKIALIGDEGEKIELGGTKNAQAYDAYLRGMQLFYRPNLRSPGLLEALAAFDEAISLDPQYAAAYVRKAAVLISTPPDDADPNSHASLIARAQAAAERAVAIAPQFGEAHLALAGTYAFGYLDFRKATREYQLAATLSPGSAYAQRTFGGWAGLMGYFDEAIAAGRRAVSLDPQNVQTHIRMAFILKSARRYTESLASLRNAETLQPTARNVQASIIDLLLVTGQYLQARRACELRSTPLDEDKRAYCLLLVYHALGMGADAARELETLKSALGNTQPYYLGYVYAQLGDTAAAMGWLIEAERQRDPRLAELKRTWCLDPIRQKPEFQALVARMKFPGTDELGHASSAN
jgi:TolB-like protein/Tfp pilus assembly protein PilF